jgi:hypothetical protein
MSRWFIGFALVVAFAAALGGVSPTSASAQTTPTPSPTPMSTMQP